MAVENSAVVIADEAADVVGSGHVARCIAVADGAVVVPDQPADVLIPSHAVGDKADVLDDGRGAGITEQANIVSGRQIDSEAAEVMAEPIDRAAEGLPPAPANRREAAVTDPRGVGGRCRGVDVAAE